MAATGITRRWVRGSLLITVLVILAAEVVFLYTGYRDLYGGVQRAAESRFSTIAGRLQATGTAGAWISRPRWGRAPRSALCCRSTTPGRNICTRKFNVESTEEKLCPKNFAHPSAARP